MLPGKFTTQNGATADITLATLPQTMCIAESEISFVENKYTDVELSTFNLRTQFSEQKDAPKKQEDKEFVEIKLTEEEEKIYQEVFRHAAQAIEAHDLESLKIWLGPAVYQHQFKYEQAYYDNFLFLIAIDAVQALADTFKRTAKYCEETFEHVQKHDSAFEFYQPSFMETFSATKSQESLRQLNEMKQAHLKALAQESEVGNNYRETMQKYAAAYKEKGLQRFEQVKKPLILTFEQAQIAFNRLKAELKACKKSLLLKLDKELEGNSMLLYQEREEFISIEEIRRSYKNPTLKFQSITIQIYLEILNSLKTEFLQHRNLSMLTKQKDFVVMEQKFELNTRNSKEQKETFEKIRREKIKAEKEAYQKAWDVWYGKFTADPSRGKSHLLEKCLTKLKTGEINPLILAKIRDEKGNTLFFRLLPHYLFALYNSEQTGSKNGPQNAQELLKYLQEMIKILFEHGFTPFQRRQHKGIRTIATAFECANQVFEVSGLNKLNKKYQLPDWYLFNLCLHYFPGYTREAIRKKAEDLILCEDVREQPEKFHATVDEVLSRLLGVEYMQTRHLTRDQAFQLLCIPECSLPASMERISSVESLKFLSEGYKEVERNLLFLDFQPDRPLAVLLNQAEQRTQSAAEEAGKSTAALEEAGVESENPLTLDEYVEQELERRYFQDLARLAILTRVACAPGDSSETKAAASDNHSKDTALSENATNICTKQMAGPQV